MRPDMWKKLFLAYRRDVIETEGTDHLNDYRNLAKEVGCTDEEADEFARELTEQDATL